MKKYLSLFIVLASVSFANVANAAILYSQSITLNPGWNIVSTPNVLDSHSFSLPETSSNFDIYVLNASSTSGWSTLADLGQTEFTPLFGYFINSKATSTQTLTLNYKASTTPSERLFSRNFTKSGWYSLGISNPTYAKQTTANTTDTNNPSKVLSSISGSYNSVLDLTDSNFSQNPNSVSVGNIWKEAVASDIDSLNDLRETKGYAIYINNPSSSYSGFQNNAIPASSVNLTINGTSSPLTFSPGTSVVNVAWTSVNTSSCAISPIGLTGISGQATTTIATTTTITATCQGSFGSTASSSVIITVAPNSVLTLSSTASPLRSMNYRVNGQDSLQNVTLAQFSLKSTSGDSTLLTVNASTSVSGTNPTTLYLWKGSTLIKSKSYTSSLTFDNLDTASGSVVPGGDTPVTYTISADFPSNTTNGTYASTTIQSVDYIGSDTPLHASGNPVVNANQYVYTKVAVIKLASAPTISVQQQTVQGVGTTTMTATFPLTIQALGGNVVMPTSVDVQIVFFNGTNYVVSSNTTGASISVVTIPNNAIADGSTANVTVTAVCNTSCALTDGLYNAALSSITWNAGNGSTTQAYGLEDFKTSSAVQFTR